MRTRRTIVQTGLAALAAPSLVRAQAPRGAITLMAYGGIFQDNYVKAVVEPFQRAFPDVKVNYVAGRHVGADARQRCAPRRPIRRSTS